MWKWNLYSVRIHTETQIHLIWYSYWIRFMSLSFLSVSSFTRSFSSSSSSTPKMTQIFHFQYGWWWWCFFCSARIYSLQTKCFLFCFNINCLQFIASMPFIQSICMIRLKRFLVNSTSIIMTKAKATKKMKRKKNQQRKNSKYFVVVYLLIGMLNISWKSVCNLIRIVIATDVVVLSCCCYCWLLPTPSPPPWKWWRWWRRCINQIVLCVSVLCAVCCVQYYWKL